MVKYGEIDAKIHGEIRKLVKPIGRTCRFAGRFNMTKSETNW